MATFTKRLIMKGKDKEVLIGYGVSSVKINSDLTPLKVTHRATSVNVDNLNRTISIVIEKGIEVNAVELTMEEAQRIGFVNFNALKAYCK